MGKYKLQVFGLESISFIHNFLDAMKKDKLVGVFNSSVTRNLLIQLLNEQSMIRRYYWQGLKS